MTAGAMAAPTSNPALEARYQRIAGLVREPVALMEVCGTHTMAIRRLGLRARLPAALRLISGPGCPVCVTPRAQIDQAVAMARQPGVVVATFGDMLRVPGSDGSLEDARRDGAEVHVVTSAYLALQLAQARPASTVIFIGVGFETTSPTVAATLLRAAALGVDNFFVLPAFKLIPPAMMALMADGRARLDGFLCPGHVSAIIGGEPYARVAAQHRVPCVVTGFEASDILDGIIAALEQRAAQRSEVEIIYQRAVRANGNPVALDLLRQVFRCCDARWRGLGEIAGSGLELAPDFARFDARRRVPVEVAPGPDDPPGCRCGEVMCGALPPTDCALFGQRCTPADPVGPCMVSSEGTCAAYHRYGG